eukprot:6030334-Karenia_brevis.AAC.1
MAVRGESRWRCMATAAGGAWRQPMVVCMLYHMYGPGLRAHATYVRVIIVIDIIIIDNIIAIDIIIII